MRPEFKGNLTQAAIHQLYEKQEARGKKKKTAEGKRWIIQSKKHQGRSLFQLWSKACTSKKSMACNAKWQANIQSFMCDRQQRLHDPGQAVSIANGVY